jgi:hypothetical protein
VLPFLPEPPVSARVMGVASMDDLKQNLALARNFSNHRRGEGSAASGTQQARRPPRLFKSTKTFDGRSTISGTDLVWLKFFSSFRGGLAAARQCRCSKTRRRQRRSAVEPRRSRLLQMVSEAARVTVISVPLSGSPTLSCLATACLSILPRTAWDCFR